VPVAAVESWLGGYEELIGFAAQRHARWCPTVAAISMVSNRQPRRSGPIGEFHALVKAIFGLVEGLRESLREATSHPRFLVEKRLALARKYVSAIRVCSLVQDQVSSSSVLLQ
jgi:hypothetical protein